MQRNEMMSDTVSRSGTFKAVFNMAKSYDIRSHGLI